MSAGPVTVLPVESLPVSIVRPVCAPAKAVTTDRLALLDAVRLVAALGIVWVHAAESAADQWLHPLGTFGVPFYTFVAVLFMARTLTRPGGRSLASYAVGRVTRLYGPFLFWSAVYVGLAGAKHLSRDHGFTLPNPVLLYTGGHDHLWFLPFLMVVTLLGAVLVRGVQRLPMMRWPLVATLVVVGIIAAALPEPAWVMRRPFDFDFWRFVLRASPTVFWSIALALATAIGGRLPRSTPALAIAGGVLLLLCLALQSVWMDAKALRAFAGLGCVAIALLPLASPLVTRLGSLGRHSYGIYLSHLVFVRIAVAVVERFQGTPTLASDAVTFVFAFTAAAALSVALSKSKWTRWTLGE